MADYDFYELYKADWQYIEGVVDAGFYYGPDRDTTGLPDAPTNGVKIRFGSATTREATALQVNYEPTDRLITCWADRLRLTPSDGTSQKIIPMLGDYFFYNNANYIIASVQTVEYETQYVCYCKLQGSRNLNSVLGV